MKPILFASDETAFTSNGMGRLSDVLSCKVTEERNGIYECEFRIQVTSPMYPLIKEGRFVGATHDDQHDIQPFEIYAHSTPIDGVVTFFAHHLSYRLKNVIMAPFTATSITQAFSKLESESYNAQPFSFWTDKSVSATFKNPVPSSCRSLLAGNTGSILDVYGTGEYEFDKWDVKLHLHRGSDHGVAIRYGVNLTSIKQDINAENIYTAIAPYWVSEDGVTVVTLPEGYVVASSGQSLISTGDGTHIVTGAGDDICIGSNDVIPVPMDLTAEFQSQPTETQLRNKAIEKLAGGSIPKESITISFVDLAHTDDYKDVAALQRVSLCDSVSVYCGPLGVNTVSMKVVKVVYNVLTETYDKIELGEPRTNFADTVLTEIDDKMGDYPTTSAMDAAIDHATQLISGGLGGYVVLNKNADGEPEEILIMDTPDTSTAVNVWRFNKNGLGHSHSGYAGPFSDIALTSDGKINASMITTGYLSANRISGGTIDASDITVTNLNASNITTGTLGADRIATGSIAISKLNSAAQSSLVGGSATKQQYYMSTSSSEATGGSWSDTVPAWSSDKYVWTRVATTVTMADGTTTDTVYSTALYDANLTTALSTASTAQSTANGAALRQQTIYKSAASGTSTMSGTTTWVTTSTDSQGVWTTTRPTYNTSYPVLFIATQIQTVSQSGTTACSCTTPVIDYTTTVIDGGHISTGTISADRIAANSIAVSKLTGTITGGLNNTWSIDLTNGTMTIGNMSAANITTGTMSADRISAGTITASAGGSSWNLTTGIFKTVSNNKTVEIGDGYLKFLRGSSVAGYIYADTYSGTSILTIGSTSNSYIDLQCSGIMVHGYGYLPEYGDTRTMQFVYDINVVTDSDGYIVSVYPTYGSITVKYGIVTGITHN